MTEPILEVRNLSVQYADGERRLRAVDGVSLRLERGGVLALVGESGSGKTTVALAAMGLLPDNATVTSGEVHLDGRDLLSLGKDGLRRVRGREVSMIFQDPVAGLNPVLPVGEQVEEIIRIHTQAPKREARGLAHAALARAGLSEPESLSKRYPYQLSGGMSQRVMIAMATALGPKVIIADEPTSALDVTVQAGILDELMRLQRDAGVSILLITHDLGVVAQVADEVAVMYAGRIAETGATRDVLARPQHPYTWSLLQTLPRMDRARRRLEAIRGSPPDPAELPEECAFVPRCRKALSICRTSQAPELRELAPGHRAACYNPVAHLED